MTTDFTKHTNTCQLILFSTQQFPAAAMLGISRRLFAGFTFIRDSSPSSGCRTELTEPQCRSHGGKTTELREFSMCATCFPHFSKLSLSASWTEGKDRRCAGWPVLASGNERTCGQITMFGPTKIPVLLSS